MQDKGIILTESEIQELMLDAPVCMWLLQSSPECLVYTGTPPEYGVPLPPQSSLPAAQTEAGKAFLALLTELWEKKDG